MVPRTCHQHMQLCFKLGCHIITKNKTKTKHYPVRNIWFMLEYKQNDLLYPACWLLVCARITNMHVCITHHASCLCMLLDGWLVNFMDFANFKCAACCCWSSAMCLQATAISWPPSPEWNLALYTSQCFSQWIAQWLLGVVILGEATRMRGYKANSQRRGGRLMC